MLNPLFLLPFVCVPLACSLVAWIACAAGFVNLTSVLPPWTLPAPLGALIATGGDIRAVVLVCINITISVIGYFPFLKIYDKKQLEVERGQEAAKAEATA
jgi:PTS system cellobiose-specific IIC component